MHIKADVIFNGSGKLECGEDEVLLGVFVKVYSRTIKYVRNATLGTENVDGYLGLKSLTVTSSVNEAMLDLGTLAAAMMCCDGLVVERYAEEDIISRA